MYLYAMPPFTCPHFIEDSILMGGIREDLLWEKDEVICIGWICSNAFDSLDGIPVTYCVFVFWSIFEGKCASLPFARSVWHCIYLLMKGTNIMV